MAVGRAYAMNINALTGLTAVPFVQLATPATTSIEILSIELTQETSETSQQEVIQITRRSTASTLPTALTGLALNENDPATLLTATTTTNAQGIASVTGTIGNILRRTAFNALNGYLWIPKPEETIVIKPSGFLTLQFPTAPAANTWAGTIIYRELT